MDKEGSAGQGSAGQACIDERDCNERIVSIRRSVTPSAPGAWVPIDRVVQYGESRVTSFGSDAMNRHT